ncbi:hypothetical protein [Lichenicoccus sp.]|uniref:hypothetical protein n=1 Tax=Lichenicoccus sp. TaxID=2781899 RepID=UPI003D13A813
MTSWLTARLATLLPNLDDARRASIAEALAVHVEARIATRWKALLDDCASVISANAFAALRTTVGSPPDTAPLLTRLAMLITPATLLRIATPDLPRLIHELASHPEPAQRERAVEALACHPDRDADVEGAIDTWSRRMLLAGLDGARALSHSERVRLRERLAAECGSTDTPPPSCDPTGDLQGALRAASDDRAAMILAMRADVPPRLLKTAMHRRDAGMLLSICWKAGCDPEETLGVQIQLGRIKPGDAWTLAAESGWPMRAETMLWRLADPAADYTD